MLKDIYVIKNKINNKVYVGQAINSQKRFIEHCKPSSAKNNSIIDIAIQKYGPDNFWFEILESQIENYNEKEQYWIKELNSISPNGYNILIGGENPPIHFGIEHPLSKFQDEKEIELLKYDLRETNMSLSQIAKKYGVSKRTVLRINQGIHYEKVDEIYPIRKNPLKNGKLTNEEIQEILYILKYTYRQYDDIGKQYGVSSSTIRQINSGKIHKQDNESYPIRKYKNSGKPSCTYAQVTEIIYLLVNTYIPLNETSKVYNINLQTIYNINSGLAKRYKREGYNYPLRKIK